MKKSVKMFALIAVLCLLTVFATVLVGCDGRGYYYNTSEKDSYIRVKAEHKCDVKNVYCDGKKVIPGSKSDLRFDAVNGVVYVEINEHSSYRGTYEKNKITFGQSVYKK